MKRRGGDGASFEKSVFINCPFDEEYLPLLRPLVFTVTLFGFEPRLASLRSDSAEIRLEKIVALIGRSQYSIHDISRLRAKRAGDFARFNLPFELGVDRGAQLFGTGKLRSKCCLMLERNQYDFHRAISDLAGVDIKSHRNEPTDLVRAVRDWFVETVGLRGVPSATQVWYRFTDFASDFYDARKADGYSDVDLNMMPLPEYLDFIRSWSSVQAT
ncbi:MAG: hypothetical protein ABI625_22120 [bacterium]